MAETVSSSDEKPIPRHDASKGAPTPGTIRRQLIVLALALVFPAAIAGILLLTYTYSKDRAAATYQLQTTARALSIVVDRQLGEAMELGQALSTAPSLTEGNFEAFDRQARIADSIGGSWVVVRDVDGRQRVNTRFPPGAALPTETETALQRRDRVLRGAYVSNLIISADSPGSRVAVVVPALRDGRFIYEVDIALRPAGLDRIFRDQQLPPQWVGVIVDRDGIIVRRSRDPDNSVGKPVAADFKEKLSSAAPEGFFESVSIGGEPTVVAYSRSPNSGWIFAVAVPRDTLGAAARRSLYLTVAIGFILMGVGAIVGRWIAGGITGPVEGLVERAMALGRGSPVSRAPTGLAETDLVASALCEADESIRSFTAMLEQKVEERTHDLAEANRQLSNEMVERKRAEQQLARIQRMEAVGQLSGGIAHDFNNLLQAIIGNVDLAKLRSTDPKTRLYLDHALSAAERGAKLTGQLLAFARKQRLTPTPVDIRELVTGIIDILRSTIDKSIEIATDIPDGVWPALSDPTQLELMLVNLAINARDAMPDGGKILIGARNVTRGEPNRPEEPPAGAFVELSVSDNGAGIQPEVLANVFEPFFTTKGVGKGSGLGLSQVLGLAQQLGGGVVIESTPGAGTSVRVYLKRSE